MITDRMKRSMREAVQRIEDNENVDRKAEQMK